MKDRRTKVVVVGGGAGASGGRGRGRREGKTGGRAGGINKRMAQLLWLEHAGA